METEKLIINAILFTVNTFSVCFICIMVSRWHRRMEDKLNEVKEYTRRVSRREDLVYMNQLYWLKDRLIEEERYEEADRINKCIEAEFNDYLKNNTNKD
ncbi:hypothetical protein [Bacteroides clarus]|jgi:hypothetical protein|uniref:hypothetical protein n=1 Tax=Bacteroides clarus TaxID=626929 RepID=UPI00241DE8F0|nr:hypothetical protein [Bacteroides clarus]